RGRRGLAALVAGRPARPGQRLLHGVGGQYAEGHRQIVAARHLARPGRGLRRDELEVGGLAADHRPEADDRVVAPGHREALRTQRQLERPWHRGDVDRVVRDAVRAERFERAGQQPVGDRPVEAGERDPDAQPVAGGLSLEVAWHWSWRSPWQAGQEVSELRLLGPEVVDVARVGLDLERGARHDGDAVGLEPGDLLRVVGQQAHALDAEVAQDLGADAVVAQIFLEAELEVRLYRVAPAILQGVRADLVRQADAPALLVQVDQDAGTRLRDQLERPGELLAAVAALRPEDVAGEALGVQADEDVVPAPQIAQHERHVLLLIDAVVVHHGAE